MTMESGSDKKPLLGMTIEELQTVVAELKMPKFTASQIAQWLYEKRVTGIESMTNLSKQNREEARSKDGSAKYLFEVAGGKMVESVYIPDNDRGNERATLCVSSQVGCKMGCRFCMTGKQGFHGNLTANEIINQIFSIPEAERLTNIVYMGMGEPTDNLDEVLKTVSIMTEKWGLAWSPKRITVSTIGAIPGLQRLLRETHVHIAISVHSPFHDERKELMPIEAAFPVSKVMELLRGYDFAHQRRLSERHVGTCQSDTFPRHTGSGSEHLRRKTHDSVPRLSELQRCAMHHPTLARRGHNGGMRHARRQEAEIIIKIYIQNENLQQAFRSAIPDSGSCQCRSPVRILQRCRGQEQSGVACRTVRHSRPAHAT